MATNTTTTTTTNETQTPKTVKLWSRCEAALLDTNTGEITLADNVDPKYLVQDLVKEIQALQNQLQKLASASKSEDVKDI